MRDGLALEAREPLDNGIIHRRPSAAKDKRIESDGIAILSCVLVEFPSNGSKDSFRLSALATAFKIQNDGHIIHKKA